MNSNDQTQPANKARRDEITKSDKAPASSESPHATPGQAEGDRATVEESLRQKGLEDEPTK